jgi:hypothetical protein
MHIMGNTQSALKIDIKLVKVIEVTATSAW